MTTESLFSVKEWVEFLSGEIESYRTDVFKYISGLAMLISLTTLALIYSKNPEIVLVIILLVIFLIIIYEIQYSYKIDKLTDLRNDIINGDCRYDTPEKIRGKWNEINKWRII